MKSEKYQPLRKERVKDVEIRQSVKNPLRVNGLPPRLKRRRKRRTTSAPKAPTAARSTGLTSTKVTNIALLRGSQRSTRRTARKTRSRSVGEVCLFRLTVRKHVPRDQGRGQKVPARPLTRRFSSIPSRHRRWRAMGTCRS